MRFVGCSARRVHTTSLQEKPSQPASQLLAFSLSGWAGLSSVTKSRLLILRGEII